MSDNVELKMISNDEIFRIRGNDKLYSDAMESMVKFNKQLQTERKSRIPFLDTQTGIAQSNAMLWHHRSHRASSNNNGQVYKYTSKNWFKNRRPLFDKEPYIPNDLNSQALLNETSNSSILSAPTINSALNINTNSNNIIIHLQANQYQTQTLKNLIDIDHSKQPTLNAINTSSLTDDWHEEKYEQYTTYNDENDSDYDGNEDYKPKKAVKKAKMSAKKKAELSADEKPFNCDRCGAKYKTKPGLNYHFQKAHSLNSNAAGSSNLKINEILNADENANSIFDSVYDDMNSSSSMPHVSASFNLN